MSFPFSGDDISGSGSGMCLGGQCSRSRPGLYAYSPDNNRVRGAAPSQTRLCSLLLLLPLAILLLQRWWTAAASNRTQKPRAGWNQGGCLEGGGRGRRSEVNFAKKKKWKRHLEGMNWHYFSLTKRSKGWQWQCSLFCFARFYSVVVWVGFVWRGDLLSWFQWILLKRMFGRTQTRRTKKNQRRK